jgi:hypothetical protein
MPNVLLRGDSKREQERLRREILTTLRIQNPHAQQSAALSRLVGNTLHSLATAGVQERELTHLTLNIARKFLTDFGPPAETNEDTSLA